MFDDRSARSKKIADNVLGSSFYKGVNIIFNLLIVRYSISYIGFESYGVWLTLLSFLTWFSALEAGISNSFRNKLTEYFSDNLFLKAQKIVTKGYKALIITYLSAILILIALSLLLPIESLFISEQTPVYSFGFTFRICVFLFLSQYIFFFVHTILLATHQAKTTFKIIAIQNGILLSGLFLFSFLEISPSLLLYAIWFSFIPLAVWATVNQFIYKTSLKKLSPSLKDILLEKSRPFKQMNKNYLIIQLCILALFSTDNLIIMSSLSGNEVSFYNLSFKYFNLLNVIFNLIMLPYWSSFTEAYYKKDKPWIKSNMKSLFLIWLGVFGLAVIMLVISNFAYNFWIGKEVNIPLNLSIFMAISVLLTCWNNIFAYFLRGVSIVRFEKNILLFAAGLNIPLSFYLLSIYNSTGVIIATCLSLLPMAILLPFKYKSVLRRLN